jgi:transcription-repair coupling factor (superfamily II helicase)
MSSVRINRVFDEALCEEEFIRLLRLLDSKSGKPTRLGFTGLTDAAKSFYAACLQRELNRPLLYVSATNRTAEQTHDRLAGWRQLLATAAPVFVPAHDIRPYEGLSPHADISEKRALGLGKLASGCAPLVVLPVVALAGRIEPPEFYRNLTRIIHRRDELDLEELLVHMGAVGYTPHEPVEMAGQFSLRGGILDVFPPEARRPARVELVGDEIESIREFDPDTQRSTSPLQSVALHPLTEFPVRPDLLNSLHEPAGTDDLGPFVAGEPFPGWEFLLPSVQPLTGSVLELCENPVLFLDEPEELHSELDRHWASLRSEYSAGNRNERSAPPPEAFYLRFDEISERWAETGVIHASELETSPDATLDGAASVSLPTQPVPSFHGNLRLFLGEVENRLRQQYRAIVLTSGAGETDRIAELLAEKKIPFHRFETHAAHLPPDPLEPDIDPSLPACWIGHGALGQGFLLPSSRLLVLGHRDLFDTSSLVSQPAPHRSNISTFLSDFRDLEQNDLIVHVDHGIGRYCGLRQIGDDGIQQEFMELEYSDGDRLYVPLTRLDLLQKFRGMEDRPPVLDRLGGVSWGKTKSRVRKAMQEMTDELLKLYAEREMVQGLSFTDENTWQREFEESFVHEETPDQLRTIEEVRKDMATDRPMDRLICGDVGYGKTEVAMRAAFRAALHSKQVAVLAPTTVLAFQHYETFRQRFAAFPITVELLSRFRTPAQQKEILRNLKAGKVDVVIGTHRLLSKDVAFHDLGLLVVDEEQRFGVRHKERIKSMKKSVDVLSLSATPIPRTLHMALAGLRDMSVIETPPRDRLAIHTVVAPFSESLIRNALGQELERGGQVFFVHNRVDSLPAMAAKVQQLAPDARIGAAHGQMNERLLEKVMLQFLRHELDILVATTIIENGLDIPLVNTIIINRADRMGLGELYQLRGRVGRSDRRAYAYLLVPPEERLTSIARRRLAALKQFTELGSGFRVAALDMELRGAGNLLSGQQHGHVNAIGLELYCQMLESAVQEMRGEPEQPHIGATVNLGLDIRIPATYIPEENQRLHMYKKIGSIRSESECGNTEQELKDRYGELPKPVCNLMDSTALRLMAERLWITSVERRKDAVIFQFHKDTPVPPERLMSFLSSQAQAQFTPSGSLRVSTRGDQQPVIHFVRSILEQFVP